MEIVVKAQSAYLVKDESLIQNSEKLYIVEFAFEESWNGFNKTAVFEAGGVSYPPVALTDDRCIIPSECLEKAGVMLRIGVSGEKGDETRGPVWCLASKIMYSLKPEELVPPSFVSGDVRAQILEVILANTATDEEVDEALDEAFGSSYDPPDNPGGSSGNVATDEEVEDILNDVFGDEP